MKKSINKKDKYEDFFKTAAKSLSPNRLRRAKVQAKAEIKQLRLAELRQSLGIRQTEVKGFAQSNVSRLEARGDLRLSTLLTYLQCLGLSIEIKVWPANSKNAEEVVVLRA